MRRGGKAPARAPQVAGRAPAPPRGISAENPRARRTDTARAEKISKKLVSPRRQPLLLTPAAPPRLPRGSPAAPPRLPRGSPAVPALEARGAARPRAPRRTARRAPRTPGDKGHRWTGGPARKSTGGPAVHGNALPSTPSPSLAGFPSSCPFFPFFPFSSPLLSPPPLFPLPFFRPACRGAPRAGPARARTAAGREGSAGRGRPSERPERGARPCGTAEVAGQSVRLRRRERQRAQVQAAMVLVRRQQRPHRRAWRTQVLERQLMALEQAAMVRMQVRK